MEGWTRVTWGELFRSDCARTSEKYAVFRHKVTTELSGIHLKHETLIDMACFTPTLSAEVIAEKKKNAVLIDNHLISPSSRGSKESTQKGI